MRQKTLTMIRLTAGKRLEHQTGSGMKWNLTRLCFSEAGEFSGMTMGGGVGCAGTLGQVILASHGSILPILGSYWSILSFPLSDFPREHEAPGGKYATGRLNKESSMSELK